MIPIDFSCNYKVHKKKKYPALPFLYLILMYTEDIKTGFEFYAENSNCE